MEKNKLRLMKFGGAVLKSPDGFFKMKEILLEYESPYIIVISALAKVTKSLESAARLSESQDIRNANIIIDELSDLHFNIVKSIIEDNNYYNQLSTILENGFERVREIIKGIFITKELTPRTLDLILSFGEFFALNIAYYYLNESAVRITKIDSTKLIVTDNNFGAANPQLEPTRANINNLILPYINNNQNVITQGFVGKSIEADFTTMGLESSNLTATIIADILNISEIIFWTDVEGIRNLDPKLSENSTVLNKLNYYQAYLAAINGLKLIYPQMIDYAKEKSIKIIYRSAFNKIGQFTEIINDFDENKTIALLKEDLSLIKVNYSSSDNKLKIHNHIDILLKYYKNSFSIISNPENLLFIAENRHFKYFNLPSKFINSIIKEVAVVSIINPTKDQLLSIYKEINNSESYKNEVICITQTDSLIRFVIEKKLSLEFYKKICQVINSSI